MLSSIHWAPRTNPLLATVSHPFIQLVTKEQVIRATIHPYYNNIPILFLFTLPIPFFFFISYPLPPTITDYDYYYYLNVFYFASFFLSTILRKLIRCIKFSSQFLFYSYYSAFIANECLFSSSPLPFF